MGRLNESRISLKHKGTLPSTLDIEGYRSACMNFFKKNTNPIFGIDFESISLISLVKYLNVQSKLQAAEKLKSEGNLQGQLTKSELLLNWWLMITWREKPRILGNLRSFSVNRWDIKLAIPLLWKIKIWIGLWKNNDIYQFDSRVFKNTQFRDGFSSVR